MTHAEKWAKHAELNAEADRLHAEWKKVCQQINDLLMTDTTDNGRGLMTAEEKARGYV